MAVPSSFYPWTHLRGKKKILKQILQIPGSLDVRDSFWSPYQLALSVSLTRLNMGCVQECVSFGLPLPIRSNNGLLDAQQMRDFYPPVERHKAAVCVCTCACARVYACVELIFWKMNKKNDVFILRKFLREFFLSLLSSEECKPLHNPVNLQIYLCCQFGDGVAMFFLYMLYNVLGGG